MASQQVLVTVLRGKETIDSDVRRPVRITPTGDAAVVYGGAAYLLAPGDVIDLSGPSWEIEDCNRFLMVGGVIPYALQAFVGGSADVFLGLDGPWTLDTTSFGHYLLFNGSERLATDVVAVLEGHGVGVQRWDVSHRPALDGAHYDWFARLRFGGSHAEAKGLVVAALAATSSDLLEVQAPERQSADALEAQVEYLQDVVAALRADIQAVQAERDRLAGNLAAALDREESARRDLDRALDHQFSLQEQLAEIATSASFDEGASRTLARQAETEELLEIALAESADLRRDLSKSDREGQGARDRVLILEATVAELVSRLDEVADQELERRRASSRVGPRRGAEGFLVDSFPRLEFVYDSVEILANLEQPAAILRALTRIDMGDLLGADLEGMRSWREVRKLATGIPGKEDMGRIYYRPQGDRVQVSVHVKQNDKEQRRHIERLRKVP